MNIAPCEFWREYESQYPTFAWLTREIFSIPATGAGVDCLFNSARDICYYRRGSLNATTIQDLMMFRCISKFDLKDQEELDTEDIIMTPEERQADDKRREAQLPLRPLIQLVILKKTIVIIIQVLLLGSETRAPSARDKSVMLLGQKRKKLKSDDEDNLPLPNNVERCDAYRTCFGSLTVTNLVCVEIEIQSN